MKDFEEAAGAKLSKIPFHYSQASQHLGWEGVKWGTGPREPERGFKTYLCHKAPVEDQKRKALNNTLKRLQ